MSDQIITSYTDPATGVHVEQWRRTFRTIGAGPIFWFAYADESRNPFDGAPGDTAAEAIGKVLAKRVRLAA